MKKDEFLRLLRQALTGDVPPRVIEENIRYYDSYITEEIRKGMPEEDVIAAIGDPRLIAKNIEDTTDGTVADDYGQAGDENGQAAGGYGQSNSSKWYWKLLGCLLLFVVVFGVFSIVGGIFALVLPLIGPLFVIWMIIWVLRMFDRRK